MDYVIIVNDNDELKTISASEFERRIGKADAAQIDAVLNAILDERSKVAESLLKRADQVFGYDVANETIDAKTRS